MKATYISIIIAAVIIGGAIMLTKIGGQGSEGSVPVNNVSVVDGVQIIEIEAKGGYWPRKSVAQAGLPTIIRFTTQGAFDCSLSMRIPSLDINKILPQTGTTDIDLGSPLAEKVRGSCGMGMYSFEIEFL